jgi:hypothetical protein
LAAILQASGLLGGPVTEDDREKFRGEVEAYCKNLRAWLGAFAAWRHDMSEIMSARFRFTNGGRVPAHDVTVQLHFPDGFTGVEELPAFPDLPAQPRFHRPNSFDLASRMSAWSPTYPLGRMNIPSLGGNVSGPRYGKGSVLVEFSIQKLQHGIPEETHEPALLRVPGPGTFAVAWEVHADNMAEPAKGGLTVAVDPATTSAEVLNSIEAVMETIPVALRPRNEED